MLKYNIIPKPNRYQTLDGSYTVSSGTEVLCSKEFVRAGNFITDYLKTKPQSGESTIKFRKVDGMSPESYTLKVTDEGIVAAASDERGAFYAAVTLKMILMQAQKQGGKATVNGLFIEDKPHYGYRGLQMDESRHFFGKEVVKRVIDQMAMLKLNTLHWHLSDDQGYRIESKLFPKLNSVASRRKYAGLKGCGMENRGEEYFYYYTQDEIREVVAYAKSLCIDVIPEIDIPGHTSAILAAYPEYSCHGKATEVKCESGIFEEILCAGDKAVYEFLDKLFSELCPLFDGKYFHIGGDEAAKGHKIWDTCPKCQAVVKENNLQDSKELQGYFMSRVNEMIKKYGKTAIAWNDCINDSFDESIVCQYWISHNLGTVRKQAFKRDMIMSPDSHFYFDVKYAHIPLKKVYKFNEVKAGFGKPGQRIRGIECEHWAEWLDTEDALQFAMFPRAVAFSEVAWTELENRRYKDFKKRLAWYKTYMQKKGINYSRVEKRVWGVKPLPIYHLGKDGQEYQKSEALKAKEK